MTYTSNISEVGINLRKHDAILNKFSKPLTVGSTVKFPVLLYRSVV